MEKVVFTAAELYAIRLAAHESYCNCKYDLQNENMDADLRSCVESCKSRYESIVRKSNTNLMATSRQMWALYLASGKTHDYRNDNLTKEQASALLDEFNKKSGYKKESYKTKTESKPRTRKESAPKANKYGVKVGDVFHMSWGYDQTNNDFFQVVELVGESSVRIREVHLPYVSENEGFMCADRIWDIPQNGEMAHYPERSWCINDNEKGDLKRVQCDDGSVPYIKVSDHWATKVSGKTFKHYESWYA